MSNDERVIRSRRVMAQLASIPADTPRGQAEAARAYSELSAEDKGAYVAAKEAERISGVVKQVAKSGLGQKIEVEVASEIYRERVRASMLANPASTLAPAVTAAPTHQVRATLTQRLANAAVPALDQIREMAIMGIELILSAYSGARATKEATANSEALKLVRSLEGMVISAVDEHHMPRRPIAVPGAARDALQAGITAITQLGREVPEAVSMPLPGPNAPLMALAAAAVN